jgi:collagenase-like PrtC family protease
LKDYSVSVLCRDLEQVRAAIATGVPEIVVDFLEVRGLKEAVAEVRAAGIRAVAASPRVLKPAEENIRAFLLKLGADAILVRSLGLLHSLLEVDGPELHGDFSLNATNRRTAELLLEAGLHRLAPGHDLNAAQIAALPRPEWASRLEVIVHHHLPIFHTEHCVFARFLSDGDDKRTCGLPCESHVLHLEGRDGKRHRVEADMGCRNTVFNAEAQSGLRDVDRFLRAGIRRFRIELLDHRPDEVAPIVALYRSALRGEVSGREAFGKLRRESRFGAGLGSLAVIDAPSPQAMKRPGWMNRT